jgi:Mn2+/Fe2+ NRAMP family transporter
VVRFPGPSDSSNSPGSSLARIAPGIVTGASNLDPSAVVTATVAGAAFSFQLLWLVVLCVPFLLAIFSVTARIGVETRRGLLDLVRENYGRKLAMAAALAIIAINLVVIVADLMAVSDAFSILLNLPRMYFVAAIAFSTWYMLIFHDYRKITQSLVVLSLPLYLYVAAAILTHPRISTLLWSTLLPRISLSGHWVDGAVAVFGSLLTPYIILWQTSSRTDPGHEEHRGNAYAATVVSALLFFSVMVASASVLHLGNATEMSTRQAAQALEPAVGRLGAYVFAVGIIGSGMVALPVLVASLCYAIAQAMGWKYGLSEQPWRAKRFYILISLAMLVSALANFTTLNPVKALYWSMILAGILTVPTLGFIWRVSNHREIVRTRNTRWENLWLGAATLISTAATGLYLWHTLRH